MSEFGSSVKVSKGPVDVSFFSICSLFHSASSKRFDMSSFKLSV